MNPDSFMQLQQIFDDSSIILNKNTAQLSMKRKDEEICTKREIAFSDSSESSDGDSCEEFKLVN